jgi:hypothetical protein
MCRARQILGVSQEIIVRLASTPRSRGGTLLELRKYPGERCPRVFYASLVRFCNELRTQFDIGDWRPPLPARDVTYADICLLPFFLGDTITLRDAAKMLNCEDFSTVVGILKRNRIDCYRFTPNDPWRVSRSSLQVSLRTGCL